MQVNNRLHKAHEELEESERKHILVLKKHQEELADVMKLHNEEKYKLKQQLESARVDYIKEIENVRTYNICVHCTLCYIMIFL